MALNAHYPAFLFCRAVATPWRWSLGYSAGQIIDDSLRHEPNMAQASFTTVSIICSPVIPEYKLQIRLYVWPFGAWDQHQHRCLCGDVTHARTEIPDDKTYQGQSYVLPGTNCSKLQAPHLTLLLTLFHRELSRST